MIPEMPKIGDMVVYHQGDDEAPVGWPEHNKHTWLGTSDMRDHPAVVTRVFNPSVVDLQVFFDCAPIEPRGPVSLLGPHARHSESGWRRR